MASEHLLCGQDLKCIALQERWRREGRLSAGARHGRARFECHFPGKSRIGGLSSFCGVGVDEMEGQSTKVAMFHAAHDVSGVALGAPEVYGPISRKKLGPGSALCALMRATSGEKTIIRV
jgi:hypothetical protein